MESSHEMPQTGRIGRFVKILRTKAGDEAFLEILRNANSYKSFDAKEKSAWWKRAVEVMERLLGKETAIGIMTECGAKCCGKGQRDTARRLYAESGSLLKFLERISIYEVKEGDLRYTLKDAHTIIAEHHKCFCKQVASAREPFASGTYCQCSVEFNRQFFSAALGRQVHVELLQSIINGGDSCKFRVTF